MRVGTEANAAASAALRAEAPCQRRSCTAAQLQRGAAAAVTACTAASATSVVADLHIEDLLEFAFAFFAQIAKHLE